MQVDRTLGVLLPCRKRKRPGWRFRAKASTAALRSASRGRAEPRWDQRKATSCRRWLAGGLPAVVGAGIGRSRVGAEPVAAGSHWQVVPSSLAGRCRFGVAAAWLAAAVSTEGLTLEVGLPVGRAAGFVTSSSSDLPGCSAVAECQVEPAAGVAAPWFPAVMRDSQGLAGLRHPASLRRGQASGFGRMRPGARQLGHTGQAVLPRRLLAGAPCRCRLDGSASGSLPARATALPRLLPRRAQGRPGVRPLLILHSRKRAHWRAVADPNRWTELLVECLCAWRRGALGGGRDPRGRMLERGHFRATEEAGQYSLHPLNPDQFPASLTHAPSQGQPVAWWSVCCR